MIDSKSLFFEYFPLIIFFTLLFIFIGQISLKVFRIKLNNDYFNLFLSLILGSSILISVYAIIVTGFVSILTGGLALILVLLFILGGKNSNHLDQSMFKFSSYKRWDVPVVLAVIVSLKLFNADGELYLQENVYSDYVFYSKVAEFLNETGVENPNIDYIFSDELNVVPYHYFDIWFCSLVIKLFNITPVFGLILIVYSIGALIIYCGYTAIASIYLKNKYWIVSLSFLLLFFNVGYFKLYDDIPFLIPTKVFFVNQLNYSKLFPIYWFIILSIYFVLNQKYFESIIVSLILVFFYSSVAPVILLLSVIAGIYALFKKTNWGICALIIAISTVSIYFAFYFIWGDKSASGSGLIDKVYETTYLKTAINIIGATLLQFLILLLLLVPVFIYMIKEKRHWKSGVILMLPFLISLVIWAILHRMHNSVQLFSNFTLPYVQIIIAIILFYLLKEKKKILFKYTLVAVAILCFNFLSYYIEGKSPSNNTSLSQQHKYYTIQVAQALDTLNSIGGYFRSEEYFNWATKSPVFGALDQEFQSLLKINKNVHSVSLSVLDTPIDSTGIHFEFEKSLVENSTFYRYYLKEGGQRDQLQKITSKFVKDYNIEYIFTVGNVTFPAQVEEKIVAKLEFPPRAEKFYVISHN